MLYILLSYKRNGRLINIGLLLILGFYSYLSLPDDNSLYVLITCISLLGVFLYLHHAQFTNLELKIIVSIISITCLYELAISYLSWFQNNSLNLHPAQFYNSGIFANYLTIILPLLLSISIRSKSFLKKILTIVLISLIVPILIFSIARAALLGSLFGVSFVVFAGAFRKNRKKHFVKVVIFLISIPLLIFFLYKLKPASANGRLNIYKVSLLIIKDKPLFGLGINKFSGKYNLYQAKYFKDNPQSMEFQLLADNTLEPFNLFIQIFTKYGIVGLLILFYLFYLFSRKTLKNFTQIYSDDISFGCLGGIIAIIVSSQFSNPFHCTPISLIFVLYLSLIIQKSKTPDHLIVNNVRPNLIALIFWLCFSIYVARITITHSVAEKLWFTASKNAMFDSYDKGKSNYRKAFEYLKYNGDFLFNYGAEACIAREFNTCTFMLEQAKTYTSSSNLFIFLGEAYEENNKYELAESNYLQSNYIVPGTLYPKYKLIMLYHKLNQVKLRNFWIQKALETPIKIESETSNALIAEMKSIKGK